MAASALRHPWLRKLALGGVSALAAFLILEVAFRIFENWSRPTGEVWAVHDEILGYRNNPQRSEHNELGLRDHPIGPKTQPRLLMLGDSVAWYGDSIDDTWVGQLDLRLTDQEVINAGVKGWTTHQQILWLERDGLALEPDEVGVGFVLNDLLDFLHYFEVEDGEIVGRDALFTKEATNEVSNPLYSLLRQSHLLVWIRRQFSDVDANVIGGTYSFESRPDFRTAWSESRWPELQRKLEHLLELGERSGFAVFLVCFPFGDQYRDDYLQRDREYVLSPQSRLEGICEELGIRFLDLYEHLDPSIHLESDGIHLTPKGRERTAQVVADWLEDA